MKRPLYATKMTVKEAVRRCLQTAKTEFQWTGTLKFLEQWQKFSFIQNWEQCAYWTGILSSCSYLCKIVRLIRAWRSVGPTHISYTVNRSQWHGSPGTLGFNFNFMWVLWRKEWHYDRFISKKLLYYTVKPVISKLRTFIYLILSLLLYNLRNWQPDWHLTKLVTTVF